MATHRKSAPTHRPESLPLGRLSKKILTQGHDAARRTRDALDLVGAAPEHAPQADLVPVTDHLGAGPPSECAPARRPLARLPQGPFTGQGAKAVLNRYATDAVAVLFDCVNALQDYAEEAQRIGGPKGLAVASMASKGAGLLADRIIGFTVGQKLDVSVTMKSQEDVPKWETLPVQVRAQFEQAIEQATSGTWEAPMERGQTGDASE